MGNDTRRNSPESLPTEILAVALEEDPPASFEPKVPPVFKESLAACLARWDAKYASLYWATHVNPHTADSLEDSYLPVVH